MVETIVISVILIVLIFKVVRGLNVFLVSGLVVIGAAFLAPMCPGIVLGLGGGILVLHFFLTDLSMTAGKILRVLVILSCVLGAVCGFKSIGINGIVFAIPLLLGFVFTTSEYLSRN